MSDHMSNCSYFALQASKSHDYPIGVMQALQPGECAVGVEQKQGYLACISHHDLLNMPKQLVYIYIYIYIYIYNWYMSSHSMFGLWRAGTHTRTPDPHQKKPTHAPPRTPPIWRRFRTTVPVPSFVVGNEQTKIRQRK